METTDIEVYASKVETSAWNGDKMSIVAEGVDIKELVDSVGLDVIIESQKVGEVLENYSAAEILDNFEISEIVAELESRGFEIIE